MGIAAIYRDDNAFSPILTNIFKVRTSPTSNIISAPVETGVEIPDIKVRMPKVVVVTCVVVRDENFKYQNLINTINKMYADRELNFYHIHDGLEYHGENFVLQDAPHERNVKEFDFVSYELTFKEIMVVNEEQEESPFNFENSNFRNIGYNNPSSI